MHGERVEMRVWVRVWWFGGVLNGVVGAGVRAWAWVRECGRRFADGDGDGGVLSLDFIVCWPIHMPTSTHTRMYILSDKSG